MGRRKKTEDLELMTSDVYEPEPVPVKVVRPIAPNPDIGKFPWADEELPTRRYQFVYNQQPGTPIEFTQGITVLSRQTGKRQTKHLKYKIEDGDEVELPEEVATHLMKLTYQEEGRVRPRCTLIPV